MAVAKAADLGWVVRLEHEDVCPAVDPATDSDTQFGALRKKTRHEIRRKSRRAQHRGPLCLEYVPLDAAAADMFIWLHQARWGSEGLFAPGEDGERSRTFLHRLVELEAAEGPRAQLHIGRVSVGDRVIYALAGFATGRTCYFCDAGMDPDSLDLWPGVVGTAMYLLDRIDRGDVRFDFLRGDEPYKYDWGATNAPLHHLVIEPPSKA